MTADPWALDLDPGVIVMVAGLAAAYLGALRWLAPSWAPRPEAPVSTRQMVFFGVGLASMWVALGWPVHQMGERYFFSAHMLQHMIIGYISAPLLLLGTPGWMLRAALGRGPVWLAARWLSKPLIAFAMFNVLIVVMHWPALVDLALRNEGVHAGLHVVLFGVSLAVWMPVVSPLPEIPRLAVPANLLYLFGQSIVPTVPASFLTFGEGVLYGRYEGVPRLWDVSALADQQVAGLFMKVGGGFLLWGMIATLFFVWQAQEDRKHRPGHLDLDELELELTHS